MTKKGNYTTSVAEIYSINWKHKWCCSFLVQILHNDNLKQTIIGVQLKHVTAFAVILNMREAIYTNNIFSYTVLLEPV